MRLLARAWFFILRLLDDAVPGWSGVVRRSASDPFGGPLSPASLNYWLTEERCRRQRE